MRARTGLMLLAGVSLILIGCRTTLEYSYWQPDFTSKQKSGAGGTEVDLQNQLGVVADENVVVYDLIGDAGRNRVRIDYWKIHGEGTSDIHGGFDFDSQAFPAGDSIDTTIDLESIGILWEPAFIKTDGFRLRIAAGIDLIHFTMEVDDTAPPGLSGKLELPGPDGPLSGAGLDYMPVPKIGVGFEADMKPWVRLQARAQMFDASYLNLSEDFEGTFTNAVAGLVFGKHRGIRLFLGYRYFNAEYSYTRSGGDTDAGNSTLKGPAASVSLRF